MIRKLLFLFVTVLTSVGAWATVPETTSYNVSATESSDGKTITLSPNGTDGSKGSIADYISAMGYQFKEKGYENIVFTGDLGGYDVVSAINGLNYITTLKHVDMGAVTAYNGSTKNFTNPNLTSLALSSTLSSSITVTNSSSDDFVLLIDNNGAWQATAKVTTAGSLAESMSYLGGYNIDLLTVTGSIDSKADANALNAVKVDLSGVTSYTYQPTSNSTTKYIIMPASETELTAADFSGMSAVLEAITVYTDADDVKCLATYSKSTSTGLLENVLAMTTDWKTAKKITMVGTYKDAITYMYVNGGYTSFAPTYLNLANAHFPSFKSTSDFYYSQNQNYTYVSNDADGYCLYKTTTGYAIHDTDTYTTTTPYSWTGRINGLIGITLIGGNLTNISLPTGDDTDVLPSYALYNCTKITELTVPANIKSIGTLAFNNMSALTSASIKGATVMGAGAFASCTAMSSVDLPSSLKKIPPYCFIVCAALKNVNLPEGVEDIEEAAFGGNSSSSLRIDAIRLPSTLKTIGYEAFKENHFLADITIPENVTFIAKYAFGNCNAIENVYFMGTTTIPTVDAEAFDATTLYNDNDVNSSYKSGEYVAHEFYSHNGAFASTTRNINDQGAAIMHYPLVTSTATYSEAVSSTDIENYNLSATVTIPTIYSDNTGTPFTGTLVAGTTYYVEGTPETSTTTTATSSPVSGITKYYSDADGTLEVTPVLASGNYWYNCGTHNVYSGQYYAPVSGYTGDYYIKNNDNTYSVTTPKLNTTYYYKTGNTVDEYSQTSYVNNHSAFYTLNNGVYTLATDVPFYNTYYYKTGKTVTKYTGTWNSSPGKAHYYTLDNGVYTIATPTLQYGPYYYKTTVDGGETYTETTKFVDGVTEYYTYTSWSKTYSIATAYFTEQVYYEDGTEEEYVATNKFVSGYTTYYDGNKTEQNPQLNGTFYYATGNKIDEYLTTDEWDSSKTYYTLNNSTYTEANVQFDAQKYYTLTGTAPTYCNAAGAAYDPTVTYYTSQDATTEVSSIAFDQNYYYFGQTTTYVEVVATDLANYIKVQSAPKNLYSKSGDEYTLVAPGSAESTGTYYTQLTPASNDLYGQYYTDLERNAQYTMKIASYDADTKTFTPIESLADYRWPNQEIFQGYHDHNYGNDPQAGLKRFELVLGYKPVTSTSEPEEGETVPDIVVPNLKYDIWYTIYLPYNMTSAQVRSTFGSSTQVCNFLGIKTETVNGKTVNTIDFSKDMITETVDNGDGTKRMRYGTYDPVIIANTPYMIKPSVVPQLDADGNKVAVQFRANGVTYAAKASNGEEGAHMPYGEYDKDNGGTAVDADYLPGYQFVGTYGQDNDGVTSVVMNDPCYYFGTTWKDDAKTILKSQAYYNYRGFDTEGWSLSWRPYTCVILPPTGTTGAKVDDIRFGVEYNAVDVQTAIQNVEDVVEPTVNTVNDKYAGKVYNMNGQYVGNSVQGLVRGMYIVNGKKIIVR